LGEDQTSDLLIAAELTSTIPLVQWEQLCPLRWCTIEIYVGIIDISVEGMAQ